MPNEKNLKPPRSTEEARERGKKGGKRSGEVRRRKKALRKMAEIINELPMSENNKRVFKAMGIDESDLNNQSLFLMRLFNTAIGTNNAPPNVKAMKLWIDLSDDLAVDSERQNDQAPRVVFEFRDTSIKTEKDDDGE